MPAMIRSYPKRQTERLTDRSQHTHIKYKTKTTKGKHTKYSEYTRNQRKLNWKKSKEQISINKNELINDAQYMEWKN